MENVYKTSILENGSTIIEIDNPIDNVIIPQLYQPTNAEVAQMISDLQADLIIAGVI